jgi:hypothetical protein
MLMSVVGKKLMVIGDPVVFESARSEFISATFDSTNNKVVIAYGDDLGYGKAVNIRF